MTMGNGTPGDSPGPHDNQVIQVDLIQRSERWAKARINEKALHRAVAAAFSASCESAYPARNGQNYELALVLSDDEEVRQLNHVWRHIDRATNVLAFPAASTVPAETQNGVCGAGEETGGIMLGDVILAFETVSAEARELGISLTQHASHLAVHGLLHLAGYDHDSTESAAVMEGLETRILAALGLHDPYAAGSSETGPST